MRNPSNYNLMYSRVRPKVVNGKKSNLLIFLLQLSHAQANFWHAISQNQQKQAASM
jgi:hypothetical protein